MPNSQSVSRRLPVMLFILTGLLNWTLLPISSAARASAEARAATASSPALNPPISETTQARVRAAYGELPMYFESNQGQFDGRVKFAARGAGYALLLTGDEALLSLHSGDRNAPAAEAMGHELAQEKSPTTAPETKAAVIRMKLVNANRAASVRGEEELPGRSNYFVGNDPAKWRTAVSHYARVTYKSVYRSVDLVYYGNGRELEYDFKLAAGADPAAIRLRFDGAKRLRLDATGELVISTESGDVRQHKPLAYQEVSGKRRQVAARYVLRGNHQVSFALARYDRRQPLVIDPVLSYSTYLGGTNSDRVNGIAVDAAGNAYLVGTTLSTNFPASHSIGLSNFMMRPLFVVKMNAAGNALIYSTLISGMESDASSSSSSSGQAIAIDAAGNAYVTGETTAYNFPTTPGAFQTVKGQSEGGGPLESFALKLNPNGSALVYSTYLGGGYDDSGKGIAVDATGHAYITGQTRSPDFPTANAMQPTMGATQDAFVTKLNATGTALVYSTYLGGGENESGNGIAIDAAGNAYVAGGTSSSDFPTANALQPGYRGRGAFTSSDGGNNWTAVSDAFPITTSITAVAIDPANSSVVYIGTDTHGSFKSTNGGSSWTAINNGVPDATDFGFPGLYFTVNDLEIDHNNPATLFAGVTFNGVLRSTDGGNSWIKELGNSVTSVKIDPTNSAMVYAAGINNGLYQSTDSGQSWDDYGSDFHLNSGVRSLAIAPTNPSTLYFGTETRGLWRVGGGNPPGPLPFPISTLYLSLAIDPTTPTTIYAGTANGGLFKSTNGGNSWAAMNNGLQNGLGIFPITSLAIDPQSPSTVYAGTIGGLFKSTNGGGNWTPLRAGLTTTRTSDIAIDTQATSHLYIGAKIADDAFVAKLNAAGSALAFSTYLGGLDTDDGFGIAVDAASNVYVAGTTYSTDIQSVNSARPFAGNSDAFVLKLSATGGPAYFTTIGGSSYEQSSALAIDPAGNASITGNTSSADFPITSETIPVVGGSCPDCIQAFVTKLNTAGTTLLYSTYLGGNALDPGGIGTLRAKGNTIAVDSGGSIYVAGQTVATNFPVTAGAFDPTYNGAGDGFVTKLGSFDICMQDETNGNLLQFNSTNGDYRFTNCRKGIVYTGKGTVTVRGCKTTLTARAANQTLTALANTCSRMASAELVVQGKSLTITDQDMANNTCGCK
ncbi:MAG: hypothetical protein V7641_2091 [Blastocatellia bacterium]